jgi:bifunctional DNase/RNase
MLDMVEVVIDSIRVSLTNQQRIVVLKESDRDRYLPIWIGPFEAEAITIALQDVELSRPQTHDLLKNSLYALGARLMRVEINTISNDVFYANLVLDVNGNQMNVDSRPSDAMALAVRVNAPILVSREMMETIGIVPEEEIQREPEAEEELEVEEMPQRVEPVEAEAISEERLSVFEDFLQSLDTDSPGQQNNEQGGDEDSSS